MQFDVELEQFQMRMLMQLDEISLLKKITAALLVVSKYFNFGMHLNIHGPTSFSLGKMLAYIVCVHL